MKRTQLIRKAVKEKTFQAVKAFDNSRTLYEIFKEATEPKRKRIKQVSAARAEGLKKYAKAKAEHFAEFPHCQYPWGCQCTLQRGDKMDLHHRAGRNGPLLWTRKYFATACRRHHELAKSEPGRSRRIGWVMDVTTEEVRQIRQDELLAK